MIRELRAVAKKYEGRHLFTGETNIHFMATDAANRIERLCYEIDHLNAEIKQANADKETALQIMRDREKMPIPYNEGEFLR